MVTFLVFVSFGLIKESVIKSYFKRKAETRSKASQVFEDPADL